MGSTVGFWEFARMCLTAAKDATLAYLNWDARTMFIVLTILGWASAQACFLASSSILLGRGIGYEHLSHRDLRGEYRDYYLVSST
jgi:hypothetical protein